MRRPNLFAYATSELSQDAFLCWVLDWLNHPTAPMHAIARELSQLVCGKLLLEPMWGDLGAVHIKRQFHGADIVLVMEFRSGLKWCLIVEDKISAMLSGTDQLERNIHNVLSHAGEWPPLAGLPREQCFGVFVKTDFDFDIVVPPGYAKIGYRDFREWLDSLPLEPLASDILRDWADWFRERCVSIATCADGVAEDLIRVSAGASTPSVSLPPALDNRRYDSKWSNPIFQYVLLCELFDIRRSGFRKTVEERGYRSLYFQPRYDGSRKENLLQGTSRGRAWIQYHFDRGDLFFYRLDWQSGIWAISLRFYKEKKSPEDLARMREVGGMLAGLLRSKGFDLPGFREATSSIESTCLLIDPCRSPSLRAIGELHEEFIKLSGL